MKFSVFSVQFDPPSCSNGPVRSFVAFQPPTTNHESPCTTRTPKTLSRVSIQASYSRPS